MENFSVCCMDKNKYPYNIWTIFYMLYGHKSFVHTSYGKVVHILYGRKQIMQHIDKFSIFCMDDYITIVDFLN